MESVSRVHCDMCNHILTATRKESGGPTLNWLTIQPTLMFAPGDVLLILDCCHAATKYRHLKDGKMEVLAACGSGSRVPAPGRLSFTTVLVREVKKRLRTHPSFSIKWLFNHIWNDKTEPGLTGKRAGT